MCIEIPGFRYTLSLFSTSPYSGDQFISLFEFSANSTWLEFSSPSGGDQFISRNTLNSTRKTTSFRLLLAEISSYLKGVHYQNGNAVAFSSPSGGDQFISIIKGDEYFDAQFSSPSGGAQFISLEMQKFKLTSWAVFVSFWRRSVHIAARYSRAARLYVCFRLLLAEISSYLRILASDR